MNPLNPWALLLLGLYATTWVVSFEGLCASTQYLGDHELRSIADRHWARDWTAFDVYIASIPVANVLIAGMVTGGFQDGFQWGVHAVKD